MYYDCHYDDIWFIDAVSEKGLVNIFVAMIVYTVAIDTKLLNSVS